MDGLRSLVFPRCLSKVVVSRSVAVGGRAMCRTVVLYGACAWMNQDSGHAPSALPPTMSSVLPSFLFLRDSQNKASVVMQRLSYPT